MPHTLFIDSDVVISSLLSSKGAAYLLLHNTDNVELYVSNLSQKELEIVIKRHEIVLDELKALFEKKFTIINLKQTVEVAKKDYRKYVLDEDDAHIILGAKEVKARFLITYNIKHYKLEKIKQDFNIIIMTPGQYLQYLRSLQ